MEEAENHYSFLEEIADVVLLNDDEPLHRKTIILPGLRAKQELKNCLLRRQPAGFISPEMYLLPEWLEHCSGLKMAPRTEVLLEMYSTFIRSDHYKGEDLNQFASWAEIALDDFGEVEQALLNYQKVFKDLREYQEIEEWSYLLDPLSPAQKQYAQFWKMLGSVYHDLREKLIATQRYHYPLLTRMIAEGTVDVRHKPPGAVYIAGLTKVSKAEEQAIRRIGASTKIHWHWDIDEALLEDKNNESGKFFRSRPPHELIVSSRLHDKNKIFHLFETTNAWTEEQLALKELAKADRENWTNTILILSDKFSPYRLARGLEAKGIPWQCDTGVRLHESETGQLIKALLAIFGSEPTLINIEEIAKRISKQLLQLHVPADEPDEVNNTKEELLFCTDDDKSIYLKAQNIRLCPIDNIEHLEQIAKSLHEAAVPQKKYPLRKFLELIEEVKLYSEKHEWLKDRMNAHFILNKLFLKAEFHMSQHHKEGVLITHILQTRAVNRGNLFFLGSSDQELPGVSPNRSFIPQDLRTIYQLPGIRDRQHTSSYLFYRLVARAKNIQLTYSPQLQKIGSSEKSRFIHQLQFESEANGNIKQWNVEIVKFSDQASAFEKVFANDDFYTAQLFRWFERGVSVSAINQWYECHMSFYYRYILGISEKPKEQNTIDKATFGSIVHDVLEVFYGNFINQYPDIRDFEKAQSELKEMVTSSYLKITEQIHPPSGANFLMMEVAQKMINNIFDYETKQIKINPDLDRKIIAIERSFESVIELPLSGKSAYIKLKGKVDRLEKIGNQIRIIDYKTGKVEVNKTSFDALINQPKNHGKLIQLLFYNLLLTGNGFHLNEIQSCLYSMIRPAAGFISLQDYGMVCDDQLMQSFNKFLFDTFQGMLDVPEIRHDPNSDYCEYCD